MNPRYERAINSAYRSPEEGRPLDRCLKELSRSASEFKGGAILDLGASLDLKFARGLEQEGIDAHVISFSAAFGKEKERNRALEGGDDAASLNVVAGFFGKENPHLPFADNSFDHVVSLHMIEHLPREEVIKLVYEVARIIKNGGLADIAPFNDVWFDKYPNQILTEGDLFDLQKLGIEYEWRQSATPYDFTRFSAGDGHHERFRNFILTLNKSGLEND
jgi:SAM-dependent methyltransferase